MGVKNKYGGGLNHIYSGNNVFRDFKWNKKNKIWRGKDLNLRPPGYEPGELPDCSTPQ